MLKKAVGKKNKLFKNVFKKCSAKTFPRVQSCKLKKY